MLHVPSFFCTDAGIEKARRPRKSMQIVWQWLPDYRANPCTLPTKVTHIAQPHRRFAPTMPHNRRCNRQATRREHTAEPPPERAKSRETAQQEGSQRMPFLIACDVFIKDVKYRRLLLQCSSEKRIFALSS